MEAPAPIDPKELDVELARICSCPEIRDKKQLQKLFKILVDRRHSQDSLEANKVIALLWGPEKSAPKLSHDLDVEMNRLRDALKTYYAGSGKSDPIRFEVPVTPGGARTQWIKVTRHIPAPEPRPQTPPPADPPPLPSPVPPPLPQAPPASRRRFVKGVMIFLVCASIAALGLYLWIHITTPHIVNLKNGRILEDGAKLGPFFSVCGRGGLSGRVHYLIVHYTDDLNHEEVDYVQGDPLKPGRLFAWCAPVHLGNENSPSGTAFSIYVLSTSKPLEKRDFDRVTGRLFRSLPDDSSGPAISVELQR